MFRPMIAVFAFGIAAITSAGTSAQSPDVIVAQNPNVLITYPTMAFPGTLKITITGSVPGQQISNLQDNKGTIDATITSTSNLTIITSDTGDVVSSVLETNNQSIIARAAANYGLNQLDLDSGGGAASNEGLLGSLQYNSADVSATVAGKIGIFLPDNADIIDSSLKVNNAQVGAIATANEAENSIVGDFSGLSGSTTTAYRLDTNTSTIATTYSAAGNFLIANVQINDNSPDGPGTSVVAAVSGVDIGIAAVVTTMATNPGYVDFEVLNGEVSALARANYASNIIQGQNGGNGNSFGILSAQTNNTLVNASVTDVEIHYDGTRIEHANITVSNNSIEAAAFGNYSVNIIKLLK